MKVTGVSLETLRTRLNPHLRAPQRKLPCFVLDDDPDVRRFMSFALRKRDAEVRAFSSIDELENALLGAAPAVVFVDVWLDGADAVDALRILHKHRFGGHVQLMTGRDVHQVEAIKRAGEARELRMLPVLQKPFGADDLRNVLHRVNAWADNGAEYFADRQFHPPALPSPSIALSEALKNDWLELWYQPKLNIQRNSVEGAEGLIRARHPKHGLLLPAAFLPGADEASMLALTEFVIARALTDWAVLSGTEHSMRLAVNAPISALSKISVPALFRDHAPKTPRWPGLIIEITEDEVVKDVSLAQEIAAQMALYKVSLAIDDFGAGYSSFARLSALPMCELKLDKSFVINCASNRTNENITQTIIDLAHRFGCSAVAEGVENGPDLLALFQMGCDIAQGNHLAPPMSREQLAWTLCPTERTLDA
jgi:EAL domain-containing protein (putative c-di-GMP-specific phosphodiesterase class I)/CheY-like chemotaxis protein